MYPNFASPDVDCSLALLVVLATAETHSKVEPVHALSCCRFGAITAEIGPS